MFEWFQATRQPRGDDGARIEIEYRATDCHCHVIPGVDDGSRSLAESLEMLQLLRFDGAQTVIATPHIFPGRFPNEADDLKRRFDVLCEAAVGIAKLELGAEYYLDETFPARVEGPLLCFGRERYVLFEAHTGAAAPVDLLRVVYRLLERGFTPLLAHVERYPWLRGADGLELCEDLQAAGARFQVNRTVGKMNRVDHRARGRFLHQLIQKDWIDEVGSDLHRATREGRPYSAAELAGES